MTQATTLPKGYNINTNMHLDDPDLAVIVFAKLADELGMMPDELAEIIQSGSYLTYQQSPVLYCPGLALKPEEN
mgnify:CR=1 FL=1